MRTCALLLWTILLLAAGCTHQRSIRLDEVDRVARLNERAAGRTATVTLVSGKTYTAHALQVTADSTSWLGEDAQTVMNVATDEVVRVQFVSRGRGALEGIGIGLLGGGLFGALLGVADGDDPSCEGWCFFQMTAEEKAALGAVVFGLAGAAVGLPAGALAGSRDRYRLERRAPTAERSRRDE